MKLYVFLIALAASMGGLLTGYDMGVMSGVLLFIKKQWELSPSMQGFVVSSAIIGCIIGALINGYLSDIIGRKKIILATAIIFLISSIFSGLALNINLFICARILTGIAVGMATFAVPLYLSEIAPKKYRGTFVSLFQLALTFGILFAYFVNVIFAPYDLNWRLMLLSGVIPSFILLFSLLPLGESPRFLLMKDRKEEAKKILQKLGNDEIIETNSNQNIKIKFEKWIWYPLFLGIMIMFVQICTGINVIIYYAPSILQMAGFESETSSLFTTVGIGIVNFLMTFVAIFLSDKIGRKPLVYSGLVIMCLAMIILGLTFYNPQLFIGYAKIVIFLSMIAYISAFSFSLGPVTYILTSELFPQKCRGFLMSVAFGANFVFNFFVVLLFLPLAEKIGMAYTLWIFAGIAFLSLIFYKIFIPETKGLSLEYIENYFNNKVNQGSNL